MAGGSPAEALAGAVILALVAGGVSAVGAVATAEQFGGEGRLSGLALGATFATAIFGGLTPYLAQLLLERYDGLTERERAVFTRVARGKLNKQVAVEVGACERTIKSERAKLMKKLQLTSLVDLVRAAGLVERKRARSVHS